jgi:soluble lytic murein transglycosylase-like protein
MQPIAFCNRCRGMRVGCNRRYISHCLICKQWVSHSSKLLILTAFASILVLVFSSPSALVFSDENSEQVIQEATVQAAGIVAEDPAAMSIEEFLDRYKVDGGQRSRIAAAIVSNGRRYNLDPFLIASIMIVESRANPFAISGKDAIGIMQIHLPTWGQQADEEGINLFKIEDNVEFGVRILKDYVRQFGLWEAVKRYKGWNVGNPNSAISVSEYVAKVQRIYANRKSEIAENLQ